jgi:hypothetical protein
VVSRGDPSSPRAEGWLRATGDEDGRRRRATKTGDEDGRRRRATKTRPQSSEWRAEATGLKGPAVAGRGSPRPPLSGRGVQVVCWRRGLLRRQAG